MRVFVWASAIIIACTVAGWSQAYYESSGQTQVFKLAAGAKVGSAAIKDVAANHLAMNNGISVLATRGSIVVTMPALQRGVADVELYDIKGRQIYRQRGINSTVVRFETKSFASGIYSVLIRGNGQIFSRMIVLNGRGN